jgi:hypothetical protein
MLPLEIKQSGGDLLPVRFSGEGECFQREYLEVFKSGKRDILLGKWNVSCLDRAGSLMVRKLKGVVGTG